jgi:hypothetical protein
MIRKEVMTVTGSTTSPLDNRRAKSAAANAAAEKARAGVTELEHRLQTNASQIEQQTQALRHAEAEAKRLKRALKVADAERARLTKQRAKAAAQAEKAQARAEAAEAKYDRVVLAELVKREKARDRAEANGSAAPASQPADPTPAQTTSNQSASNQSASTRSASTQGSQGTSARRSPARGAAQRRAAAPDPPPEQPNPGTAEAVKTAARRTRRAAG